MAGLRYAILGDVHSNLEALEAVLADAQAQGATRFACVGDIVGYNADPVACLQRLRDLDCCRTTKPSADFTRSRPTP